MPNRLCFIALATAFALAFATPAARAATPKDTVVIAWQLDGIITFDPGESYEIATQEFGTNIYDRLMRYEAEDVTKLVGGVAESWTVSPDAKTYTLQAPPEPEVRERRAGDRR